MVGCGQIAQAHAAALRYLAEDGTARLVAVADPDPDAAERIAKLAGTVPRCERRAEEVIGDPGVDAVVVVAPTIVHRPLIEQVVASGKPLFTEKPLAPHYADVRAIVEAVVGSGLPAQVGFQSRFHPIIRRLHDLVTENVLGAPMGYVMRDDQFWPTGEVVDGHTTWRSRAADAGGGALLEHSIHSCDILGWLFGPVRRVYATTRAVFGFDVEDTAALTIEHESGTIGTLLTVFNGVQDREERRFEVFFERGAVEATTDFVVGAPEDGLLVKRERGDPERVDCDQLLRDMLALEGLDPDRPFFVYQYLAHRSFAQAIADMVAPTPDVLDALAAHQLVEAAYRSATHGRPVPLEELER
jgi:predicted dehydrogenase